MGSAHSEGLEASNTEENMTDSGLINRLFNSVSFIEKVALLLLTMLLSGIVVPLAINYLEGQSNLRASAREQAMARAEALLKAQTDLLEQFTQTVLTYQSLALDVSWYGTSEVGSPQAQTKAFARYDEQINRLFTQWRAQASRANLLASSVVGKKMEQYLDRVLELQDTPLYQLRKQGANAEAWDKQHRVSIGISYEANELIAELAIEMGLIRSNSKARSTLQ